MHCTEHPDQRRPGRHRKITQPEQARRRRACEAQAQSGAVGLLLVGGMTAILLVALMGRALFPQQAGGLFTLVFFGACACVVLVGVIIWLAVARHQQRQAAALSRALEDLAAVLPADASPLAEALAVKVAGLDLRPAQRACLPLLTVLADLDARGDLDAAARRAGQRLDDLCSTR